MGAGKIQVVVGGQFGSEAKGAVAGHLARGRGNMVAVRVAGPNAGHSAVDDQGRKWALRQIPVMAVTNPEAMLVIAAGSEIDEAVLEDEILSLEAGGFSIRDRLYVDGQATIIDHGHKLQEAGDGEHASINQRLGSTAKGVGAARADRIWRQATIFEGGWDPNTSDGVEVGSQTLVPHNTLNLLTGHLKAGRDVIIEGTQGYGLGLHAGYYPFCTSSDCRAVDFMAMTGVSPWAPWVREVEPWVVLRTFPIRVAGNSGPLLAETSWEDLHLASQGYIEPEYTTVTKKMRRVGGWDPTLAMTAVQANGGSRCNVALSFFDYWFPELAGVSDLLAFKPEHWERIGEIQECVGARVRLVGTGPATYVEI